MRPRVNKQIIFTAKDCNGQWIKHTDNSCKGFTLLELMIVILIIMTLISSVCYAMVKKQSEYSLKNAASDLYNDLQTAKSLAVLTHETVQIVFKPDEGYYFIQRLGTDGKEGGDGDAKDQIIKTVVLSAYKNGIKFGNGCALKEVTGESFKADDHYVTYKNGKTTFGINGVVNILGYVYLTNQEENLCYAVGTPTYAGVIRIMKTMGNEWTNG